MTTAFQLRQHHIVCFTGRTRQPRRNLIHLATQARLTVTDNASNASVLVVGTAASSTPSRKTAAATRRGLPAISEAEFIAQAVALRDGIEPPSAMAETMPAATPRITRSVLDDWAPTSNLPCTI